MRYGTAPKFLPEAYFNGFQTLKDYGSISRTTHDCGKKKILYFMMYIDRARYGTAKDHISGIGI